MAESLPFKAAVTAVTKPAALTPDDLAERATGLACVVAGFAGLELDRRLRCPMVDIGIESRRSLAECSSSSSAVQGRFDEMRDSRDPRARQRARGD